MSEPQNVGTASSVSFGGALPRRSPHAGNAGAGPGLPRRSPTPTTESAGDGTDELRALVAASRSGDERAFECLYDRFGRMVHGILLARVPRLQVDDLVQEVFLAAWQRLATLRDAAAFGGWIAMIARNRATDFHRQSVEDQPLDEHAAGPQESPTVPLEAARALAAIRSLPDAYRETLVLRLVEGLTGPEIADRTGLTPASVRVNLHRGMKLLREKLGVDR
jgi:RNA polymerase sigma-70 factor (ECF subfamily)